MIMMLNCVSMSLAATGAAYYALYRLGDMGQLSWIMLSQTAPGIAILFATPFLMKKFDKTRLIRISAILMIAGSAGFGIAAPAKAGMIAFNMDVHMVTGRYLYIRPSHHVPLSGYKKT